MGLFGNNPKAGGFMDMIRCDEPSYLIWKWHPKGSEAGNNNRENAIRWGSSLRVKAGEVAVFAYSQNDGLGYDYIEGPYDQTIQTENLPILASIIGMAYDGGTPFQAEVYFINLAQIIQVPFAVPYFDLFDSRYPEFGVPTAVRGTLTFRITDYEDFIKLHRLQTFSLDSFQKQIRDSISRYVKAIVTSIPDEKNIPIIQIEKQIDVINELVEEKVKERLESDFGVSVTAIDIGVIEIDKNSEGYRQLKSVTQDLVKATAQAQAEINIKNMQDMQRINAEDMEEKMRIQREESQYAQRIQTRSANFATYQMEQQAAVGIAGAEALGSMAGSGADFSGGGLNPAGMMAGMVMGGAIGQNVAGVMNGMMNNLNQPQSPSSPPPIPSSEYNVVINGEAAGPFSISALSQMVSEGKFNDASLVWKPGMSDWIKAENIQELKPLFGGALNPPPVPPTSE